MSLFLATSLNHSQYRQRYEWWAFTTSLAGCYVTLIYPIATQELNQVSRGCSNQLQKYSIGVWLYNDGSYTQHDKNVIFKQDNTHLK